MTLSRRAVAMAQRLDATAARLGVTADGRNLMARAFQGAMERRGHLDDHHPDYLHTARTAVILMDDMGVTDAVTLASALVLETRSAELTLEAREIAAMTGEDRVAAYVGSVPTPALTRHERDTLLEALVTASSDVAGLALAERLDHARHLHLRDPGEWSGEHQRCCGVYAPVAQRVDPVLERRFTWWCATFARKFLHDRQ